MYVALVPNRSSPPAYLLREGYREDGKVKSRTLANLSLWPLAKIERLRRVLRDEVLGGATEGLTMLRSLPHGHVAAVLGIVRKIRLDRLLAAGQAPRPPGHPGAGDDPRPRHRSGLEAGHRAATRRRDRDLFAGPATGTGDGQRAGALRRARLAAQPAITHREPPCATPSEPGHAGALRRQLYLFRGPHLSVARRGYSRDGKRDKLQIIFGLLC